MMSFRCMVNFMFKHRTLWTAVERASWGNKNHVCLIISMVSNIWFRFRFIYQWYDIGFWGIHNPIILAMGVDITEMADIADTDT